MQDVQYDLVITFNGEIYNFRELRYELSSLGYLFESKTDTEVILKAYAEWGVDCFKRFNGMFAFACWINDRIYCIWCETRLV